VLTHAHLDHSGYLPRLVRSGFTGQVWCTHATASLCGIMLPDSGRLLEEEAGYANRKGTSKHHPALPLYSEVDANGSLRQLKGVPFEQAFEPVPGVKATLRRQGHILGAAAVTLEYLGTRITFSGDLGRPHDPVMLAPLPPADSDWIVTESTYGDRVHPAGSLKHELGEILRRVAARGGVVVIPAFAVGRAQLLLHVVAQLQAAGEVPSVPVFLNSPMAASVTSLYRQYRDLHRLDDAALDALQRTTQVVSSVEQSKALNRRKGPMVIISASGMATGGGPAPPHRLRPGSPQRDCPLRLPGWRNPRRGDCRGRPRGAHLRPGRRHQCRGRATRRGFRACRQRGNPGMATRSAAPAARRIRDARGARCRRRAARAHQARTGLERARAGVS